MKKLLVLITGLFLMLSFTASAGLLRDRIEKRLQKEGENVTLPSNIKAIRDFSYGQHPEQRMDIYVPNDSAQAGNSPMIVMVHGGGWRSGDKAMTRMFLNKMNRWVSKGFIFVSVDYRLVPDAMAYEQAEDVALAVATIQKNAAQWGGNAKQLMLMGHSAGAHIVSLLSSNPTMVVKAGGSAWLGTVSLDGAAMNVPASMQAKHLSFYDDAFGKDAAYWQKSSPYQQLTAQSLPMFAVCSTQRKDKPCKQYEAYASQAKTLNVRVEILPQNLSHKEINETLGLDSDYTKSVEKFMASLSADVQARLNITP